MRIAGFPFFLIFILSFSFFLTSCKSKKDDGDVIVPLRELYGKGISFMNNEKYADAAEEFGKVFLQYPGNNLTPQAELMQAYSLFLGAQYEDAVDVLDIFIALHPMHEDIAYAYYLKSLSYYMQISHATIDQSKTKFAKDTFLDVIKRFPNTKYAIDASLKIDLVNDHLAGHEMVIGRYYLSSRDPIASINRFKEVVQNYSTTSHIPEALYRLVESYLMLGLQDEAKRYGAILGHNYRDNIWYKKAYELLKG